MKKHYLKVKRETLKKRDPNERIVDFHPTYEMFSESEASLQSARCIKCPIDIVRDLKSEFSFCRTGCPLENKIPIWVEHGVY